MARKKDEHRENPSESRRDRWVTESMVGISMPRLTVFKLPKILLGTGTCFCFDAIFRSELTAE